MTKPLWWVRINFPVSSNSQFSNNATANFTILDFATTIFMKEGETANDKFGTNVSKAGDYNMDGMDDIVVSTSAFDGAAGAKTGKIYIYLGF